MEKYDLIAIGDITTDAFIKLKQGIHIEDEPAGEQLCLNFGDKLEYDSVDIIYGVGNSGNAAVASARLGLTTALVADIGNDINGDKALEVYKRENLSTEYIKRHSNLPTHYHFILRYGAERTILIKHQPWPYKLPNFTQAPSWIYFSSVGRHGENYHHQIAQYVRGTNTKLAFQPGTFQIELAQAGKIADLMAVTDIFFCNKQEAQKILSTNNKDVTELLKSIANLGPQNVIITDGPRGAYALTQQGTIYNVPMYPDPAPPVDRTGAGDAFSSTVVAMLAMGLPLQQALLYGPINSMSVVQYVGAQQGLLSKQALDNYLAKAPDNYIIKEI